jgi:uncharacterized membrane protein
MDKGPLEAFSDGVIAIIITIMVLELKVPHGSDLSALRPLIPVLSCYVLSFVFLGVYWNNHHHLLKAAHQINGKILWANLHLLFWLSLVPFTTSWMGETKFSPWPVAIYGMIMFFSGVAYSILTKTLIANHGHESNLAQALKSDVKGKASICIYGLAIPLALIKPLLSCVLYIVVTLLWLVPDHRIEKVLNQTK